MSTQVADQLKVFKTYFPSPMPLHLAVQGSRSKVVCGTKVNFQYQNINAPHYFDICNLAGYDIVLGTPFLYQYNVHVGLNPTTVEIGSSTALPMSGDSVKEVRSQAMTMFDDLLDKARADLREYAEPICKTASETPLPPLRVINHTIPLIDEHKIYPWHPSRCPEAFRSQWDAKRRDYLASGRWKITSAGNTVPMLLIPKVGKQKHLLRTVIDL